MALPARASETKRVAILSEPIRVTFALIKGYFFSNREATLWEIWRSIEAQKTNCPSFLAFSRTSCAQTLPGTRAKAHQQKTGMIKATRFFLPFIGIPFLFPNSSGARHLQD